MKNEIYLLVKIFEISHVPGFWISYVGAWGGIRVWYTKSLIIEPKSSGAHNIIKTSSSCIIPIRSVIIVMGLAVLLVHYLLRRFNIVLDVHLLLLILMNLIWENNTICFWNLGVALCHSVNGSLILLPWDSESVDYWPLGLSARCTSRLSRDSRMHDVDLLARLVLQHHKMLWVLISYTTASSIILESIFLFLMGWEGGVTSRLSNIWEKIGLLEHRIANIGIERWFLCRQEKSIALLFDIKPQLFFVFLRHRRRQTSWRFLVTYTFSWWHRLRIISHSSLGLFCVVELGILFAVVPLMQIVFASLCGNRLIYYMLNWIVLCHRLINGSRLS